LEDGPRVLDCIEFSDRLRYGDVLADVAFLAMDLERLGAPRLADHFLERWGELMGETHPASLAHHYIAYRALVRCKVACVRHGQGDPGAGASAGAHLELARRHLERGRVVLALVGGLPGTGKSTVAEGIGRACGWTVLRSDEVRQELTGDYTPESVRRTYEALVTRAEQALHLGLPVVLDATWGSAAMRELAAAAAARTSSDLVELRCVVDPAVAARRIATRREAFGSEATPAVATALATRADPWPSAVDVDTEGDPVEVLGRVLWNLSTQR
ncbi:MAG TPA: AAA family ATPase, partial [Acidimicrobiales bacterium]|nr:AAA family ATPase [Acidimicrobiales bacterium]